MCTYTTIISHNQLIMYLNNKARLSVFVMIYIIVIRLLIMKGGYRINKIVQLHGNIFDSIGTDKSNVIMTITNLQSVKNSLNLVSTER